MIQTRYNLSKRKPEIHAKRNKVERSGYVSAQKRIENLIQAGVRLKSYRQEQYDFDHNNIDEDAYDRTRRKGYDMGEAFQDGLKVEARLKQQEALHKELLEKATLDALKIKEAEKKDPGQA